MEPVTIVLVVLGVLVALAAVGAVVYAYRQRAAQTGTVIEGTFGAQDVSIVDYMRTTGSYPYYTTRYFFDNYFTKYGTATPPSTGRVHTEVLWQHPVMEL